MRVAVIGAGSWGTAFARLVGAKIPTRLWARRADLAEGIQEQRENSEYLPGFDLPAGITATADLEAAVTGAAVVVMAVPSHGYRRVLEEARPFLAPAVPIISLSKGVEQDTLMRMTEVTADVLPDHDHRRIGVLTGPNLAREIAAMQPTASVRAVPDDATSGLLQHLFMAPTVRVYTTPDVSGCEAAGALKNVMAIAAGMARGLGFGDNTLAALITRALAELTRLGIALGGNPLTFSGLAGMGDLVATCMSPLSRNHKVGFGLGQGRKLDDIIEEMNMVAEGVKSTKGILEIATRHGVEMPIAEQVGTVLYAGADPQQMVFNLMLRQAKPELHGIE